ncbi:hypothetical protein RclHR1_00250020 [Rhizophagus clarus]|uniref:Uncharacterized protein n=1 Tax=Rhizophagus clarus TaxID=94130 RepID=A0A2Z6R335_9GLOM|nr:hypothetical protein RclHR1_00250020 [Rhizophagus clarus]
MTSNTVLLNMQTKKYHDILNLLADKNCLIYNYALYETIRLMESSLGRPNKKIEDKEVIEFAFKAAKYLLNYQWTHYNDSTTAQLEFFLNSVSLVLYVLLQSVEVIDKESRTSFYKSISRFWKIYRNMNYINANVMFRLREIRNYLRKIKDNQSNVVQNEHLSAFTSIINVLDFEYPVGKWYDDWKEIHETYFKLHQKFLENNLQSDNIKKFSKELLKLSTNEFEKLTFKAIEILYVIYAIKGNVKNEYFKGLIAYNFSQYPQSKLNNISSSSYATSDITSFSTPQQSPPILSVEENQKRQKLRNILEEKIPLHEPSTPSPNKRSIIVSLFSNFPSLKKKVKKDKKDKENIEIEFKNNDNGTFSFISKKEEIKEEGIEKNENYNINSAVCKKEESEEVEKIIKENRNNDTNNVMSVVNEEEIKEVKKIEINAEEIEKVEENAKEGGNNNIIIQEEENEEKNVEEIGNNNINNIVEKSEKIKEENMAESEQDEKENLEGSENNNIHIVITEEEGNKENIEKISQETISQEKTHLIINHYTTVNHIIQTQQSEQPEESDSRFFKTIKKVIKEIENIVDKAAKVHNEAVSKSNSELSVNIIDEEPEKYKMGGEVEILVEKGKEAAELGSTNQI